MLFPIDGRGVGPVFPIIYRSGMVWTRIQVSDEERGQAFGIIFLLHIHIYVGVFDMLFPVQGRVGIHKEEFAPARAVLEYHTHASANVGFGRVVLAMVILLLDVRVVSRPEITVEQKFETLFVIKHSLGLATYAVLAVGAEENCGIPSSQIPGQFLLGALGQFLNPEDV